MHDLTEAVAKLAAALLALVTAWVLRTIAAKARTEREREALTFVAAVVAAGVADAMQKVRDLKAPDKPGEWGPMAAAAIKASVIADAKRAAPRALAVLTEAAADPDAVDTLLSRLTEAQVEEARVKMAALTFHGDGK